MASLPDSGPTPAEPRPRARILLAEDEIGFREAIAGMLRLEGYSCVCAGTRADAVAAAESTSFELLLADIRMPGNQGLQLVKDVLAISPATAVIVITGYPSTETAIDGIDLSISAYLRKPVEFEEVLQKVQAALGARGQRLARGARLDQLEEGFRALAHQLGTLGNQTGLLGRAEQIAEVPELSALSPREWDVLRAVLLGYRPSEISEKLRISTFTVRNHLKSIFRKLDVRSQSELMMKLRPISS